MVLEDVTAPALLRQEVHLGGGIEEDLVVQQNTSGIGFRKPAEAVQG